MAGFGTLGVAAVAVAILAGMPIAGAEDPSADCTGQPSADGECEQQQQQLPSLPKLPDNNNSNNSGSQQQSQQVPQQPAQQPQQAPQQDPQRGIDLSDKNCWVVNGVPTMWSPALSQHPGDVVQWCPSVYGLQPH